MITNEDIVTGLVHLGFTSGWAINDNDYDNLLLWEHDVPKPPIKDVLAAANEVKAAGQGQEANRVALRASAEAKLAALGLTVDEIATVLP
jgi:hypothetical protein